MSVQVWPPGPCQEEMPVLRVGGLCGSWHRDPKSGPKDHRNITRILQSMGLLESPPSWGLEPACRIIMFLCSLGPLGPRFTKGVCKASRDKMQRPLKNYGPAHCRPQALCT